jgi:hypothetical protein
VRPDSAGGTCEEAVVIRFAKHRWGRDTADVQIDIRAKLGDDKIRFLPIGIVGEFICSRVECSKAISACKGG